MAMQQSHAITIALRGDNVLDAEMPGLLELFGSAVVEECKVEGSIDYMRLYDNLGTLDRRVFESSYEDFNRRRQNILEGFSEGSNLADSESNVEQEKATIHQVSWTEATLLRNWSSKTKIQLDAVFAGEDKYELGSQFHKSILPYIGALKICGSEAVGRAVAEVMLSFALEHGSSLSYDTRETVSHLVMALGRDIEHKVLRSIRKRVWNKAPEPFDLHHLESRFLWHYEGLEPWIMHDRAYVGSYFLMLALKEFRVGIVPQMMHNMGPGPECEVPAFWKTYTLEYGTSHVVGVVKVTDQFKSQIDEYKMKNPEAWHSQAKLPMLVKPRPWTSYGEGGYLYSGIPIQTSTTPEQLSFHQIAISGGRMSKLLNATNAVCSTAWGINRELLRVVKDIWLEGIEVSDIPGIPKPVSEETLKAIEQDESLSPEQIRFRKRQLVTEYRAKKTIRAMFGTMLSVATKLGKHGDRFYFPHQIDFRGRMYPVSPTGLSYMNHDVVRGLLQFWYGKPLGADGWKWLKIHASNVFGYDKASNSERERFAEEHMDDIIDSATNPLDGKKWWLSGDKPFQTLAACFEIHQAVSSGNPETFVSRLCVNQDGTCNGLQHYSALVCDKRGASLVNMLANPKEREDIYTGVLRLVEDKIGQDAACGHPIAKNIHGKVTRGVVKQSVMTKVYGVTSYGILKQVERNMEKDAPDLLKYPGNVASYIQKHLRAAIDEMFAGATALQEWLMECADRITQSVLPDMYPEEIAQNPSAFLNKFYTTVAWTSPLGITVAQPYRTVSSLLVRTPLQTVSLRNPYRLTQVSRIKQINGISPNFVHTLDASHMMMTGLACRQQNVTFAAVHDSFWTHAATVPQLSSILRQQFVELYKGDPLERIYQEFLERYASHYQCVYVLPWMKSYDEIIDLRRSYKDITPIGGQSRLQAVLVYELARHGDAKMQAVTPFDILKTNKECGFYKPRTVQRGMLHAYSWSMDAPSDAVPHANKALKVLVPLVIPRPPAKGDLDVSEVVLNPFFFS